MSTGKKIPGECPGCGNPLSRSEMDQFLGLCEAWGRDPIELAFKGNPPGIHCAACVMRTLADGVETGDPGAKRLLAKMRLFYLGIEELPDGKPIVWH